MPLLWKTLLYIKIRFFLFTLGITICLLLISRATEIAKIAVMCHSIKATMLFLSLHLLIFFPISLPIASLISAYFLQKHLLDNRTFFALLSSSIPFSQLFLPIFFFSATLSIFNFFAISELSTLAWRTAKNLPHQFAKKEPIQLAFHKIQKDSIAVVLPNNIWDRTLVFFAPNNKNRMTTALIKKIEIEEGKVIIDNLDTVTYLEQEQFDHIFLENKQKGSMVIGQNLNQFLPPEKIERLDYCSLAELFKTVSLGSKTQRLAELLRRFFWSFSILNFMFIGFSLATCSFRAKIGLSIWVLFSFTVLFFASAFIASPLSCIALMLLTQSLLFFFSYLQFQKIKKGVLA